MTGVGHQITLTVPSLRWSSVRDCPRKAVYEATGAPKRERTIREDRQLARGRAVGHEYLIALAAENRRTIHVCSGPDFTLPYPHLRADEENAHILAELQVQWELGTGHADAYMRDTDTVLEILSSQSATGQMIRSKLVQAAGYAHGLDATSVCVVIVDPATLEDERVIVTDKSKRWGELMGEVDERVETLRRWRIEGELPGRVCSQPSDAWGHFCLHAAHCFSDWTPPAPLSVVENEEAVLLASQLTDVKAKRRELSSSDRVLERQQKEIQQGLETHVPAGEHRVGSFVVKRSVRAGRRGFDFDRAELDGRLEGVLGEFVKYGQEFSVWDVERAPADAGEDYGEVPF